MASNPELSLTVDFFRDLVPMFSNQIPSIKDLKNQLVLETTAQMSSQLGRCYVFGYSNPKGYEKGGRLKYHHIFPASIMIGEEGGDMIGINPYYIPPRVRVKVIDFFLNNLTTNRNIDANDRTVVIYQKIKNTALGEAMKPAIKRYIKSRISSRVVRLSPRLWIDMYLGQTSSKMNKLFRGASVSEVYRDYRVKFLRNY